MRTFHTQSVKKSRKCRRCDWCGEAIEIGQPYDSYMWAAYGDTSRIRMHPECHRAAGELATQEGGFVEWMGGEFQRGSIDER